ncbi:EAL domain-containing protein [Oceanisphaera avium]|uniref:RNase E specificity factor CsrD n=1 Tax=Oceanisphaera avium TaxID=1903694 RepID=A0A1Y0D0Y5_9GAMM|nr:EAL domain-containing protein [Oceanisphaera avium]ART80796.1 RNase E specificity factor CsrD [Oceanisphaera avium]
MKFTNQFITTISLCILTVVMIVLIGAGISFYHMGSLYQQRQVDTVLRLVDEGWQASKAQPDIIDAWLPNILEVNGIIDFTLLQDKVPVYHSARLDAAATAGDVFTMEYTAALNAEENLVARLVLRPPFYNIDHSFASLAGISGAIIVILVGSLIMLRWFRRQFRGAELLALRSEAILQDKPFLSFHDHRLEWPHQASQALDKLALALKDARKERSRFDSFMRANVFLDRKIGIGNRVFFDNRLEAALNDPACHGGALLLVEIQDLMKINYHFDYERGDELLTAASIYMGHFVRGTPGALQARYTGNTFAILLPNTVESEAQEAARQLMKVLRRLNWPEEMTDPAVFIGGVCFSFAEPIQQIQEEAELALRSAELQGGEGYFIYYKGVTEENMGKGTVRWRTLLTRVLAQQKIQLDRQGIYIAPHQAPIMYELLARIQDEQGRELSAGQFFPMAEKCGLLYELDRNILSQALARLAKTEPGVSLAVNLSATSLLQSQFYKWLLFELLQIPKVHLNKLVIDLSEAQVSRHFHDLIIPLRALKKLGCQLAVDHAGQDVVSTQYVKDYELDYLKLHPSLVRDIDTKPVNQMAVSSLIGNSAGGKTKVIAMGVETLGEWQCLSQLGVYAGQGYFFAYPELGAEGKKGGAASAHASANFTGLLSPTARPLKATGV